MSDYFICPVCGCEVNHEALSCPECGSDDNTGWSQNTIYDGLDLPYEENEIKKDNVYFFNNKYVLIGVAVITIIAFFMIFSCC